jgi:sigma-B regulation protein RsbU (phosphoserine phosphatase)
MRIIEVFDELQRDPAIDVLALLDQDGKALGVLTRRRLLSLLGMPFGRDLLGRSSVQELLEPAKIVDANRDVFSVAAELIGKGEDASKDVEWSLLVDEAGKFRGCVSRADLASWLSRMTQEDVELAGSLQERLVAGFDRFDLKGFRGEAWSRSAKGVGGDLYFTKALAGDRSFTALCDVSGKGVAASLVVSMVWGMLRAFDIERGLLPEIFSVRIGAGESVIAFSDGIPEQENSVSEEFGEARFLESAARAIKAGKALASAIPEAISAFQGTTPQQDDMTFVWIERRI